METKFRVQKILEFINKRKGFVQYVSLKVLIMMLSFLSNVLIIRRLSVSDYGLFSVALMFTGLVTTFGFSWSSSSILYYGSREKAKTGSINKTFWARNIIIAVSLFVTTILFILFKNQINEYIGLDITFLILIWLYVSVAEDFLVQYFLTVKKQLMSSLLSLTAKLLYLLIVLIVPFNVKELIIINIVSHATVLLYVLGINKRDVGKFEFDKDWFKEILNFSLWQLFGFSGIYLTNFGDTAVIKYFMTTEDIAIYNVAFKLFNAIVSFSYVISSYYAGNVSRYFVNNEQGKIKSFFYRERFLIFGMATIAHIVVMIFSKPVIITLYGERYIESIVIFNILMIGSIFRYWNVFYMLYYNTNGKHKLQQLINIFSAIINIFFNVILIKKFGLIGPAIGTTLSFIITTTFSTIYCEKRIIKRASVED